MDKRVVILRKVSNNLNRSYRTCENFGIKKLELCDCDNAKLKGNLFKSKGRVKLEIIDSIPVDDKTIYFETDGNININDINLSNYTNFCFGGESNDLPHNKNVKRVFIPKLGCISGLTVEASIAIVLFKLMNEVNDEKNNN